MEGNRRSRRAVLGGAAGAVAVLLAKAIGRVPQAQAADGDTVTVSGSFSGTGTTRIETTGTTGDNNAAAVYGLITAESGFASGLRGFSASTRGRGVAGEAVATTGFNQGVLGSSHSDEGAGVWGVATATRGRTYGVLGEADSNRGTGVRGFASSLDGSIVTYGVDGEANSTSGVGVRGFVGSEGGHTVGVLGRSASGTGVGVRGQAESPTGETYGVEGRVDSPDGVGVRARNVAGGTGLRVEGKAEFIGRSGSVTIAYPRRKATVRDVSLTPASIVLATVQNNVGVWVKAAVPTPGDPGSFDILLNEAPGSGMNPKTAVVGWLIAN